MKLHVHMQLLGLVKIIEIKSPIATSIDSKMWNLCLDSNFSINTYFKGVTVGF